MAPKVLIRTPNHLGDGIMALPMIEAVKQTHPGAQVTLLAPEHLSGLYADNPAVDDIACIPDRQLHGLKSALRAAKLIAKAHHDLGYILPPSLGSALAFKLGGVNERIGYASDGRRLLLSNPLPLPRPLNSVHRSKLYLDLLGRGQGVSPSYVAPKLLLNADDLAGATRLLSAEGVSSEAAFVVIAARAVAVSRRWGKRNYTLLAEEIGSRYSLPIVMIGGGEDHEAAEYVVNRLGPDKACNLAGKTSLREAAAVLARARLFVGNDSGPAHLAAAVESPLVVLSGADDPRETSPVSSSKRLVYLDHLDCISCVKNRCPLSGDRYMQCMTGITVPMVMAEVTAILD